MYEATIEPKVLLQAAPSESIVKNIKFDHSLSDDSYIKVLFCKSIVSGIPQYETYDFTLNQWKTCNISDISILGIDIDKVKDIPEIDLLAIGNEFSFAYFLHLEPYGSSCSIENLNVEISLSYGWQHCNINKATYEYPMLNKLTVKFMEEGDFKVNYMDKP
jgi:hypothetical protein